MSSLAEIETFVAVARLGGVSRAAGHLHRSQPAITRRLSQLEHALGVPLLERTPAGTVLTEAGRAYLPHAEAALAALRDGAEALAALEQADAGPVSLAIVGTLADSPLVAALQDYLRRHPAVRLDLRTANSREVSDLVRRGDVALGLRYFADPGADLTSLQIGAEPMVLVCVADHRLAGRRLRRAAALRGERWLAFPAGRTRPPTAGNAFADELAKAGLAGADVLLVDSLTAQKRLVEAGFGIARVPASAIRDELRTGSLALIEAPGLAVSQPICAIHRKNGYLNGATRALLAGLRTDAAVAPSSTLRHEAKR